MTKGMTPQQVQAVTKYIGDGIARNLVSDFCDEKYPYPIGLVWGYAGKFQVVKEDDKFLTLKIVDVKRYGTTNPCTAAFIYPDGRVVEL